MSKPADAVLAGNWRLYNKVDAPHMREDRWDASSVSFSKAGLGHMLILIDLDWVPFADVSFGLPSIFGAVARSWCRIRYPVLRTDHVAVWALVATYCRGHGR